jgi:ankyrin repeat protein
MRVLVKAGADVNLANKDGWTPLYAAASNDHEEAMRVLVEAGAEVNLAKDAAAQGGLRLLCRDRGDVIEGWCRRGPTKPKRWPDTATYCDC